MTQAYVPSSLVHHTPSELYVMIWGQLPRFTPTELLDLRCQDAKEVLDRFLKIRWANFGEVDLCSLRISGPYGDDEIYKARALVRYLPRTFIVPWSESKQSFDSNQAVTGLTKIAGMQDEGNNQVLDIKEINQLCQGGLQVSVEKANGKACTLWVKQFAGIHYLGVSSKTYADPQFIYPLPKSFQLAEDHLTWAQKYFKQLEQSRAQDQACAASLNRDIAYFCFKRFVQMSAQNIALLIDELKSGMTLCGELEEAGKHVIPTQGRVVFFVGSRMTQQGIQLDSPLNCQERLATFGFQNPSELGSETEPFSALASQPGSLELGEQLREGRVRYFLNPQGKVVATMKIKDPHYMFYRKLRNAMCAKVTNLEQVMQRLLKSARDPYYQSCLRSAGIPSDFTSSMLRSALCFLTWFSQDPELGTQFDLAGFQGQSLGLGALLTRWKQSLNEPHLGEYQHIKAFPEIYMTSSVTTQRNEADLAIAMLSFHAAQGSGKTSLARLLCRRFNQRASMQDDHKQEGINQIGDFALALEQDPLQKKRLYLEWLESHIYPEIKAWLLKFNALGAQDELPQDLIKTLSWEALGEGRTGRKFICLLENVSSCFRLMLQRASTSSATSTERLQQARLLIINARCNQNVQATQGWMNWLEQHSHYGLASLRLNAPLELLESRIKQRDREGDEQLLGEVVRSTQRQVQDWPYVDQELDATKTLEELVNESLETADLALNRVEERWFLFL